LPKMELTHQDMLEDQRRTPNPLIR
jgi:hypothetical protein